MKKYRIHFKEVEKEEAERKIKGFLNEEKNAEAAKTFISVYASQPTPTKELASFMTKMYKKPYDKNTLLHHLWKLKGLNLITSEVALNVITNKNDNEIHREIKKRYYEFLDRIPKSFRHSKVYEVQYFYVTDYGEQFIKWSAKSLGLEVSDNDPKRGEETDEDD